MPVKITTSDVAPLRNQRSLRLFCLPYAAGSARIFRGWQRDLPRFVEVCPLELPGHGRRSHERPIGELEPIMADLLSVVLRRTDRPIAILGYDYGALLGFELAHRLERDYGLFPRHLFVAAMRAPVWPRPADPISEMPDDEFRKLLQNPIGQRPDGGADGLLGRDSLMEFAIRVVRADFSVADNYEYGPDKALGCPITAFRGRDDPGVSRQSMQAWNVCTKGDFRWHEVNGGHYFLHRARELFLHKLSMELRDHAGETAVPLRPAARVPSPAAR